MIGNQGLERGRFLGGMGRLGRLGGLRVRAARAIMGRVGRVRRVGVRAAQAIVGQARQVGRVRQVEQVGTKKAAFGKAA